MRPFIRNKTKSDLLGTLAGNLLNPMLKFTHKRLSGVKNNKIDIRREKLFDRWADDLWLKCRNQHKIWIARDYQYLSWRYNMRPESQYNIFAAWINNEIAGYIITTSQKRIEGNVSFILDVLVDFNASGVIEKLLLTVINQSMKNNDALISAMIMPNSAYRKAFQKKFFIPLPKKLFPQELNFGGRMINKYMSKDLFYNPNYWHITWGDTDLL